MPALPDLGPRPRLGYVGSRLERAAERRGDIIALEGADDARAYVFAGDMVLLRKTGADSHDPLFTLAQARAMGATTSVVFLGLDHGAPRFAVALVPEAAEARKDDADLTITDLRSIAVRGLVEPDHLPPLAEGKAIINWHVRHRFCPNCGQPTRVVEAGWRRDCDACKTQHFPRTDPVVIMLVVAGERCLLGRSHRFTSGMWSCLAGFVEPGETIEEAVRREVLEETGIRCGRIAYFTSQPWPFPSSLMIGCHAEALTSDVVVDPVELAEARWFSRADAALMLARQHPQGFTATVPIAIAYHIIRAWVEGGIGFA